MVLDVRKKEVFQIDKKTGVSHDYYNEFAAREFLLDYEDKLKESILKFPIKKYVEHFPEDLYENVITKKNIKFIKELDDIVVILNTFGKSDLSIEEFKRYLLRANKIIYS